MVTNAVKRSPHVAERSLLSRKCRWTLWLVQCASKGTINVKEPPAHQRTRMLPAGPFTTEKGHLHPSGPTFIKREARDCVSLKLGAHQKRSADLESEYYLSSEPMSMNLYTYIYTSKIILFHSWTTSDTLNTGKFYRAFLVGDTYHVYIQHRQDLQASCTACVVSRFFLTSSWLRPAQDNWWTSNDVQSLQHCRRNVRLFNWKLDSRFGLMASKRVSVWWAISILSVVYYSAFIQSNRNKPHIFSKLLRVHIWEIYCHEWNLLSKVNGTKVI